MMILTPQALLLVVCLYAKRVVGKRFKEMEPGTNECTPNCREINYMECEAYAEDVNYGKFYDKTDNNYYNYIVSSSTTPKGCYAKKTANKVIEVFFNTDGTGAGDPDYRPVCTRKDQFVFMDVNTNECTSGSSLSYEACASYAAVISSPTFGGYYRDDGTYYQYSRKDDAALPAGCYRDVDNPTELFYNDDRFGSPSPQFEPICVKPAKAACGGDPHFFGFEGFFFSWQGHCDAILSSSPNAGLNKEDVMVHIRTTRRRKWSIIEAVVVSAGDDVVEIDNNGKLLMNGSPVKGLRSKSFNFSKKFVGTAKQIINYVFDFGDGKLLEVKSNTRNNMVFANMSGNFPKGTVGLLGSPQEPGLFARDGTDMNAGDVNEFAESWQVRDTDRQLFQNTRIPQYPNKCIYDTSEVRDYLEEVTAYLRQGRRRLDEINTVTLEQAVAACATINSGPFKTFCEEDIMATGDLELADDPFYRS